MIRSTARDGEEVPSRRKMLQRFGLQRKLFFDKNHNIRNSLRDCFLNPSKS